QTLIGETATLTAFTVNEAELDSALATSANLSGYNGEPISIKNEMGLTFSVATSSFAEIPQTLPFKVSGQAQFVWTTDTTAFAKALAGQSRSAFATILQQYPHITKADVSFFPLWLLHFPSANKIHINISQ
ncbi:MAG TPA: hypothetical protein VMR73_01480, partial [Candidatus Paceibacterota bacterium]|nr:hypothetical protein [Candidatus Paceibacterota bacterium]